MYPNNIIAKKISSILFNHVKQSIVIIKEGVFYLSVLQSIMDKCDYDEAATPYI